MNKFYKLFTTTTVLFLFCTFNLSAQLTVDSTFSPTLMVQTLLGGGITTSNITYTGDTVNASGFFSEPSNAFGIVSGIMLTSGTVSIAPGPNNVDDATQDDFLPG